MIGRALRKHAPRTVKDASAHNALLRECRPRIERVRGKLVAIPNAQLCKVENLNADQCKQKQCRDSDVFSDVTICHPPPP